MSILHKLFLDYSKDALKIFENTLQFHMGSKIIIEKETHKFHYLQRISQEICLEQCVFKQISITTIKYACMFRRFSFNCTCPVTQKWITFLLYVTSSLKNQIISTARAPVPPKLHHFNCTCPIISLFSKFWRARSRTLGRTLTGLNIR